MPTNTISDKNTNANSDTNTITRICPDMGGVIAWKSWNGLENDAIGLDSQYPRKP